MKRNLVAILLLLSSTTALSLDKATIEGRNEAAGFVGTMKFFVGRVARTCQKHLDENDAWVHGVVDEWLKRNSKYSSAAEKWVSAYVSAIANQVSADAGKKAANLIMGDVRKTANAMTKDLLGNKSDKVSTCRTFRSEVVSGKYDITTEVPTYPKIIELIEAMN